MSAVEEYMNAQKLGTAKLPLNPNLEDGKSYLPVLDDILKNVHIERQEKLGLEEIPLEDVIGTVTRGRTTAFASNFMPILGHTTEFGMKWIALCDSHLEEGIHDPIIVWEYLNKYYVVEGNKRVSVLKYFKATNVLAEVTRVIPAYDPEDSAIVIYYEFLDFYRATTINYIHFSQKGNYAKLLAVVGKEPTEAWTEDELMNFRAAYTRFAKVYSAKKKTEKFKITVADAFLAFLQIYGYDDIQDKLPNEIKEDIPKIWEEFLLLNSQDEDEESVELKMDPSASSEQKSAIPIISGISSILPIAAKKKKVAFLYDKTPETSSWTYSHELGRLYVAEQFENEIETHAVSQVTDDNAEEIMEDLIAKGYTTIFTTTPNLVRGSLKIAVEHPDIKILNCSLNMSHRYIRTYYARMYEAKFISGAIAGAMTDTDHIGYIASYPIYGMTANINAFALGAKMTNPRVKVHLAWSCLKDVDIYKAFEGMNVSHISEQDMITPYLENRAYGLIRFKEDGEVKNVASTLWDWGQMYERIIQSILNGGWKREDDTDNTKALNYWWGMSSEAIDILLSREVPPDTKRLVNLLKKAICAGDFNPFSGVLIAQDGEVISDSEDSVLSPEQIVKMNWLNENVIGSIPKREDLLESTLKLIELQGIIER